MNKSSIERSGAITVQEFARTYSISKTTVYAEIKRGRLKAVKVGSRTLILKQAEQDWCKALSKGGVR